MPTPIIGDKYMQIKTYTQNMHTKHAHRQRTEIVTVIPVTKARSHMMVTASLTM